MYAAILNSYSNKNVVYCWIVYLLYLLHIFCIIQGEKTNISYFRLRKTERKLISDGQQNVQE